MIHKSVFVVFLLCLFSVSCSQKPAGPIYKVSDKTYKTTTDAVFGAIDSKVFFVGEHHDNHQHHVNQLKVIREIHENAEKPLAIGLEMFSAGYQRQLDQWVNGDLALDDFVKIYYDNWDLPWFLYRDIFFYAREHQIPLIALNIAPEVVRKVARNGFKSLGPEDLSQFPQGITCNVTPEYESFIKKVFGWHGTRNRSFSNFCEAQVLWDTIMAINILKYTAQNPDTKMVILAGDGHSWKPGIPRQLLSRRNLNIAVFVPETPSLSRKNVSVTDTDYLWLPERL
jgi:uncharacterized iron-regulated protein